jgi:uncharacterized protein HemY
MSREELNKMKAKYEELANQESFSEQEMARLRFWEENIETLQQKLNREEVSEVIKKYGMKMPEKLRKHFPDNGDGGAGNNDESPAAKRGRSGH